MRSLWTDDDHGAHPWMAGASAAPVPAPTGAAPPERRRRAQRFARPALIAGACAAAAVAGALIEVLR